MLLWLFPVDEFFLDEINIQEYLIMNVIMAIVS